MHAVIRPSLRRTPPLALHMPQPSPDTVPTPGPDVVPNQPPPGGPEPGPPEIDEPLPGEHSPVGEPGKPAPLRIQ